MITVVITTCKREPDIVKRAVQSVTEQTFSDWELILIDDSPIDYVYRSDIETMVKQFENKYNITYIANEVNSGACFSRNVGLNLAKGEYIAFLDDDDEWLPEKLEKQVNALSTAESRVALVYGPYYKIIDETKEIKKVDLPLLSGMLFEELMKRGNFLGGMSMPMMKTACVKDVGGFDNLMQSAQDMDLFLRIAQCYEIISINCPLVYYHMHSGEQITTNPQKKIAGLERLIEKNKDYIEQHKEIKWQWNMGLIQYYILAGRKKEAFSIWKKTIILCPNQVIRNLKKLIRFII